MSTTSLKLSENLKARIVKIAAETGKSAHAFMVDVLTEQTERIEKDRAFMARAEASLKHHQETGIGYDADEVNAYFRAKIQGIELPKPQPKRYK